MTTEKLSAHLAAAITDVARLLIREGVHVNRTALSVLATLRSGPRRITRRGTSRAADGITQHLFFGHSQKARDVDDLKRLHLTFPFEHAGDR